MVEVCAVFCYCHIVARCLETIYACVSSRGAQSTELVSLYIGYWTLNNYYYYYYYMAHVCFYVCCSDCVGVCGNVCCVAAVVKNSVVF